MINGAPSLVLWSLSEAQPIGFDEFVGGYVDDYWMYGSGKIALRDGLATCVDDGENVLVPSYIPDAVIEPIRELGLEPRHYAITDSLAPDMADLTERLDDETLAITSVNYFGFPQPGLSELSTLATDRGCYHVDDNAHSPLSVHDGQLLGTVGDIGITSLWKLFPISNGAVLYLTDDSLVDRFEPSPHCGSNDRFDIHDVRFVVKSFFKDLLTGNERVKQSMDTLVTGPGENVVADPPDRYEAAKTRMSKLASHVVETADPTEVRRRRRNNYRAWLDVLADRPDLVALYHELPDGICPQVFPVYAERPQRLLSELATAGVDGADTWPRLSRTVRRDPAYETATRLSRHVVVLPVHQQLRPETVESIGRSMVR